LAAATKVDHRNCSVALMVGHSTGARLRRESMLAVLEEASTADRRNPHPPCQEGGGLEALRTLLPNTKHLCQLGRGDVFEERAASAVQQATLIEGRAGCARRAS
jgi:hypothetical protein